MNANAYRNVASDTVILFHVIKDEITFF